MKHTSIAILLVALLLLPFTLAAQHTGHAGGTGSNSGSAGGRPPADTTDLTDFKHLLQVQADMYQTAQFQAIGKDMADALKQTHSLAQLAASGSPDLGAHATAVNDAVDEACKSNKQLVKMLTDVQVAGLKKLLKELNKSETAVTRQQKSVAQAADHGSADAAHISAEAGSLEKALTEFRTSQLNLAQEMGVQPPSSAPAQPPADPSYPPAPR
jgi:hypothetical protein